MKKILAFLLSIVIALSLVACNSKTTDINCSKCGEPISSSASFCSSCGAALNASETETEDKDPTASSTPSATDSVPETNATSSTQPPHSHSYGEATCTSPAKCSCGATNGSALGHSYSSGKCSRCGASDPNYVAHSHAYGEATCTSPAKCSCGATNGSALGHSWNNATCTSAKTCSRCGSTNGSALGHSYSSGKCSRCGAADPNNVPVEKILFDKISLSMIVGDTDVLGVTVYPYNATNQILYWESSDTNVVAVDATGNLTAKSYGSATISAHSANGVYAVDCQVVVKENPILGCNDFPLHLYSYDGKDYLGKLVTNKYDSNSIWNEYGTYGSKYQTNSIWNEYGKYGSKYQSTSAFNPYASQPPKIVTNSGRVLGYLTASEYKLNGYTIIQLERALKKVGQ